MMTRQGNLFVSEDPGELLIYNGRVRIRLFLRDGGYAQEFFAIDKSGRYRLVLSSLHKNLIPSSEHRVCSSPMISGERRHLFGVCRESLRMVYSDVRVVEHTSERAVVELSGKVQGHALSCRLTLRDAAQSVHARVEDTIDRDGPHDPLVEYLMSSFAFIPAAWNVANSRPIDCVWAPLLRPNGDELIGDCAFHSPAVLAQQDACMAALVPDLSMLAKHRPMPTALDMDIANGLLFAPLLSYGFCNYEPAANETYCRHDITMARRINPPRLQYAYHIFLDAACGRTEAFGKVARFVWSVNTASNYLDEPIAPMVRASDTGAQSQLPFDMDSLGVAIKIPVTSDSNSPCDPDPHTGMRPINCRTLLAEANADLDNHGPTERNSRLLERVRHALDQACLLQSVWRNPWGTRPSEPGMLARGNQTWKQDAELTAEFAVCAMKFGALTGDRYYFERGALAIRAATSAHVESTVSRARIQACAQFIKSTYGSLYIDIARKWGITTSGGRIRRLEFARGGVSIDLHPNGNGGGRIVFGGVRGKTYRVSVDGHGITYSRGQIETGVTLTSGHTHN
jgi:hypothetical protein